MTGSLLYSPDEQELQSSVRRLLGARADWGSVLGRVELAEPYDLETWRGLVETGVPTLPVDASWRETAAVAEELGRAPAIVPFLGTTLAAAALLALGEPLDERRTTVLAVPLSSAPGLQVPESITADGDRLSGTVTSVADARLADVLLVPAGGSLYAVEDFTVAGRTSLDLTRPLGDVTLQGALGRRLGPAEPAVARALLVGAGILASEQLGLAEQCLETTVDYLKGRYQFGRPLGSYQGLKHRLASLWVEVTRARAAARYAAACLADDDPDVEVAVALAGSLCSDVAVLAAEECVQLHGGLGFTWEHPAHLWLKRAKADQIALGTPDRHRARLADLVGLPMT
jgi:alkylation response protein AidB-like acyl-CoA dehydrogenase